MTKFVIIVALVLLVALALAVRVFKRKAAAVTSDDPNVFMPALASEAVQFAAARNVSLDYTTSSVESVESLLSQLHALRSSGNLTDDDLNLRAHQFGAYIGEVLRRRYGGEWKTDHEVAGPKSFPFHWKDGQSFPVGWCGKRMLNGTEDNVWFKFQVVTSDDYQSGAMTRPSGGSTGE